MDKLSRRNFVSAMGVSLAQLAMAKDQGREELKSAPRDNSIAGRRPNVIVMICDDLGSGDLGCYGSKLNTPNLDEMARGGVRFTHFNAAHPICSASRSALLTGRYAERTGTKPVYFPRDTNGLSLEETTLADLLRSRHYRTMCVGKWHLGHQKEYLPTSRGFDSFFGVPYSVDMHPLPMFQDAQIIEPETDRSALTPRYTDAALRFIETRSSRPFFLYLAYSYPHIPIDASPRFKGKSRQGAYGDAVEEIDWSVGEILSCLGRNNLAEETLVIFTSDHGPWYQGSPGDRRGRKGTTYEGGYRTPFLVTWREVIPAGHVCDAWTSNLDLLPTLAAICGAELPAKLLDGADISPLFVGGRAPGRPNPVLYFSGMRGGFDLQCARQGSWKLRMAQYSRETYVLGSDPGENLLLARPELYDLDNDPAESYDLASKQPALVGEILRQIDSLLEGFPENVRDRYSQLKKNPGSAATPAGAAAKPSTPAAP